MTFPLSDAQRVPDDTPPSIVPKPDHLIGRERELAELAALIRDPLSHLVTLTGPGGVGKTRLARAMAESAASEGHRVFFVSFASLESASLVASEIARTVDLTAGPESLLADRLAYHIRQEKTLLVLDNFEHVLDAAPLVGEMAAACPTLSILITSRIALRVSGEIDYRVRPLEVTVTDQAEASGGESPAALLFITRAALQRSSLSSDEVSVIVEVCKRLDGLPLAIELAAAQMRLLSPIELLSRLDRRLPLLEGGPRDAPRRLRSMHDAIAWSYGLLSEDEQALFRSLSVFEGGFTLGAVEAIAPETVGPVLPALTALLDHNVVYRSQSLDGQSRFGMLETIREFALDSLRASGEEFTARQRHLHYYIQLLGDPAAAQWIGPQLSFPLDLTEDQGNLRSAFGFALEQGNPEMAAKVCWGLLQCWLRHGQNIEGMQSLERLIAMAEQMDGKLAAAIHFKLGWFVYMSGDLQQALHRLSLGLEYFRTTDHLSALHEGLNMIGVVSKHVETNNAVDMLTEALGVAREMGSVPRELSDLTMRAFALTVEGRLDLARKDIEAALLIGQRMPAPPVLMAMTDVVFAWIEGRRGETEIAEQFGLSALERSDHHELILQQCLSRRVLGEVAFARGQPDVALGWFQASLERAVQSNIILIQGYNVAELGMVASALGDRDRAALLYGAARASWQRLGFSERAARMFSTWRDLHAPSVEEMGDELYRRNFAMGMQMSDGEILLEAMAIASPPGYTRQTSLPLSRREVEILELLSDWLTNQEIADRLFISKRTVDRHVSSILSKLGVGTRREAVAVARRHHTHAAT